MSTKMTIVSTANVDIYIETLTWELEGIIDYKSIAYILCLNEYMILFPVAGDELNNDFENGIKLLLSDLSEFRIVGNEIMFTVKQNTETYKDIEGRKK